MQFKENIVQRAREGKDSYGLNLSMHDCSVLEMAARAGYDFVRIDCEHMLFDYACLSEMIRTAKLLRLPLQLRVTDLRQASALLDMGADALMIPHVRNAEIAEQAVAMMKYAPLGERGMTGAARILNFGETKIGEYAAQANDHVALIVQIEDKEGLDNIDEILSVPGVDMVATGKNDLSQALGVPGENTHPTVIAAEDMVIERALAHGKIPTLLVKNTKRIEELHAKGVHCFSIGRDDSLLYSAMSTKLIELKK